MARRIGHDGDERCTGGSAGIRRSVPRQHHERRRQSATRQPGRSVRTGCFSSSARAAWAKCGSRSRSRPIRRTVALKLIKAGMDTKAVVARFESERQALALMDHPNIAHVYDAGTTPEGRPYFVMEYVQGQPITRLLRQAPTDR